MNGISTYLMFNGTCEAALKFYEQALGAKIEGMMPYSGSPMAEKLPPGLGDKIIHARLNVGGVIVMASDDSPDHYRPPQGFHLAIGANDAEEAERLFSALAQNGTVQMPLQETFWAARYGMLTDQFGVPWMVNCEKPMPVGGQH